MEPDIIQLLEMIAAVIATIIAIWQNRQKNDAVQAREEAIDLVQFARAQQWESIADKQDVVSFFDPADDRVTEAPDLVPARSWKMNEETKKWVICGHDPQDQASLLTQISEAEALGKVQYIISVPGCYYEIEYGLLKGGGKGMG
ncbi:hypothetical protein J2741_001490 [Methanolinea mesophila]|uniref:hypothetical protein n=1 Tax=Methanolinea mesophila TaxID=547055 RepID=UPI001AE222A4|nr:hypothetical protein [Methanolinea mesophila]MBP1928943.1 hypothetical protein [Methanolinea mesophila]